MFREKYSSLCGANYFGIESIVCYDVHRIKFLLWNAGIVHNRIKNTGCRDQCAEISYRTEKFDSFEAFIWPFVDGSAKQNR